jgi:hypothetical protein
MRSVTDVRLILFQWAKAKPQAISMKTGNNWGEGLK